MVLGIIVLTGHGGPIGLPSSVTGHKDQFSARTGQPYVDVKPDAALRLDHRGGQAQLDLCDGAWTLMEEYKTDGLLPLWAQHDYCGGSQILRWKAGDKVSVEGSSSTWQVTGVLDVPEGSTLEKTRDMKGDLLLQTCHPRPSRDLRLVAIKEL